MWLMGVGNGDVICGCCCWCTVVALINRSEVVAINYGFPLITLSSSFGVMKNALNAKQMNTIPPTMVTGNSTAANEWVKKTENIKLGCCKLNAIVFLAYRFERKFVAQSFGHQSQPIRCTAHGPTHHQLLHRIHYHVLPKRLSSIVSDRPIRPKMSSNMLESERASSRTAGSSIWIYASVWERPLHLRRPVDFPRQWPHHAPHPATELSMLLFLSQTKTKRKIPALKFERVVATMVIIHSFIIILPHLLVSSNRTELLRILPVHHLVTYSIHRVAFSIRRLQTMRLKCNKYKRVAPNWPIDQIVLCTARLQKRNSKWQRHSENKQTG